MLNPIMTGKWGKVPDKWQKGPFYLYVNNKLQIEVNRFLEGDFFDAQ